MTLVEQICGTMRLGKIFSIFSIGMKFKDRLNPWFSFYKLNMSSNAILSFPEASVGTKISWFLNVFKTLVKFQHVSPPVTYIEFSCYKVPACFGPVVWAFQGLGLHKQNGPVQIGFQLARHCWCHMATPVELNLCFQLRLKKKSPHLPIC